MYVPPLNIVPTISAINAATLLNMSKDRPVDIELAYVVLGVCVVMLVIAIAMIVKHLLLDG